MSRAPLPTDAGLWRAARALARRHRRTLAAGLALVAVNRAAALALPLASRQLVDDVIGRGRGDLLAPIALAAAAAVALQGASGFALSRVVGVGAQRAVARLRVSLHVHVLRLPLAFHDRTATGALVARVMTDTEQLRLVAGPGLVQLAGGALTAALALGVLVALHGPLTLAVVALLAALAAGAARGFAWLRGAFLDASVAGAALTGRLAESLGGIAVVKACAAERREALAFARGAHALLRAAARAATGVATLDAATTLASGGVSLLVLVVCGRAVLGGTMTLGDLVLYASLVGLLTAPLLQGAAMAGEAGRALAALGRIVELHALETEDAEDRARGALPVPRLAGDVALIGVSHAYEAGGPFALRDVELVAPAGSTTALVGRSGSGKSTLCRLLLAHDRPTRGRVLVDGRDLAMLRRSDYRRFLGVVPQEGFLFDASVADNIRYARPGATAAEVRAAARAAGCDEFVELLPRGYETVIGERGVALSGGQRQRVAIARALLADPRILILDEATSCLDVESEALIRAALAALTGGRTTFVIAHRLATVEGADRIVVLEGGRVVERGRHEELWAKGGAYRGLWEGGRGALSSAEHEADAMSPRLTRRTRNGWRPEEVAGHGS